MTPAASSNTDKQMSDTFLMTNMTPQVPAVNRVVWRNLEAKVRREPFTHIVTGAIYNSPAKTIGKNRVPIPTAIFKIVYPVTGRATAYYVDNIRRATVRTVPIEDIEKQIGIDFP
jgi:endonuclease G